MFNKEAKGEDGNDIYLIDAQEQEVEKKVQKYLAEDLVAIDDSPLKWWKNNHFCFPTLSQVMKQCLCIPATFLYTASLKPNTAGSYALFYSTKLAREVIYRNVYSLY